MRRLANKTALVTGGASGLGAAISRRLVSEGASVVITDIQAQTGERLAAELNCSFIAQDVTDEIQWRNVIQSVEERFGGLQILVNNAGITGSMDQITPEDTMLSDWRAVHRINVEGVFLGCRAAIPAMRRSGGGAIVNMSSIAGLVPMPQYIAYGASKAEVLHFTKSVALYCARNGSKIRCNSVHPGNVLTPLLQQAMEGIARRRGVSYDEVCDEFKKESPQREFLEPEDIASAVLYLVSDEAKQVTGIQLTVDGGTSLRMS